MATTRDTRLLDAPSDGASAGDRMSDLLLPVPSDAAGSGHSPQPQPGTGVSDRPAAQHAVPILVDAMLARPGDEALQQRAVLSLKRMAVSDGDRALIGRSGCIQTVVTAMRTFSSNVEIVLKGCTFLANVAYRHNDNQRRVLQCRGVELVVALMRLREHDDEYQRCACHVLRNVTEGSVFIQLQAVQAGVLEALQRVLTRFHNNVDLQIHGIAAIGNTARSGLETQQRIRECGCVDVILEAMRTHASFALQEKCVGALRNVSYQNEPNQRLAGKLGGVELLTDLMRNNQGSAPFLVEICSTLRYMCFEETNRTLMGRNGALLLMIESLIPVSDYCVARDVEKVLKALSNATFSPQENKQTLVRCGGIEAVLRVLHKLRNDAEVLSCGLRVFRNVVDRGGVNTQLLASIDAFSFCIERAEHFRTHEGISEHLFAMLLDATEVLYDEDKMGRPLDALKDMVSRQLKEMPENVAVQQLGRGLWTHLERLELRRASLLDRKRKKKALLRKLRRTIS